MKLKRIAATVSASFEDILAKIENHEAVADCAIEDMRRAVAQIKVQVRRSQAELTQLREQVQDTDSAAQAWHNRAIKLAEDDEEKALQCLKRAEQQQDRKRNLQVQVTEHENLVDQLTQTLQDAEGKLQSLALKRTSLVARDARNRGMNKIEAINGDSIQDVFDRWETTVLTDEAFDSITPLDTDLLERELIADEEKERLLDKLANLRANKTNQGSST